MKCFLGVGKQAPLSAVTGDIGLLPPTCRQAVATTRLLTGYVICRNQNEMNRALGHLCAHIG